MDSVTKYQGKLITESDLEFISHLVATNPQLSRRQLSKKLCDLWDWRQGNGHLKDMLCRSLLLQLHRSGYITLPPIKFRPNNPLANRTKPKKIPLDTRPISAIPHHETIKLRQVRRTADEDLYNSLIDQYHYLGYGYSIGGIFKLHFFYC